MIGRRATFKTRTSESEELLRIAANDTDLFKYCSINDFCINFSLREVVITKIPFIMSSSCTSGVAAYEDKHTRAQGRIDGDS